MILLEGSEGWPVIEYAAVDSAPPDPSTPSLLIERWDKIWQRKSEKVRDQEKSKKKILFSLSLFLSLSLSLSLFLSLSPFILSSLLLERWDGIFYGLEPLRLLLLVRKQHPILLHDQRIMLLRKSERWKTERIERGWEKERERTRSLKERGKEREGEGEGEGEEGRGRERKGEREGGGRERGGEGEREREGGGRGRERGRCCCTLLGDISMPCFAMAAGISYTTHPSNSTCPFTRYFLPDYKVGDGKQVRRRKRKRRKKGKQQTRERESESEKVKEGWEGTCRLCIDDDVVEEEEVPLLNVDASASLRDLLQPTFEQKVWRDEGGR
jgi:hypothetical protein